MTPLFPKKVTHRKWHRMRHNEEGIATRGVEVSFGSFGLKAQEGAQVSTQQLEAARKVIARYIQKGGRMWIRVFPDHPRTAKPPEVGMGAGKGDPVGYYVPVKAGAVLLEVDGLPLELAKKVLKQAGSKLPVKTRFVSRS